MSHTYASVEDFKKFTIDGGDSAWDESDAMLLTLLEGASRRVDAWAARSDFGSGYGPRVGTNRYDHDGSSTVLLDDDLLGVTGITITEGTGGGTVNLAIDTDYYLRPYGGPPYTEIVFTGIGQGPRSGLRVLSVAGTFGFAAETVGGLTMGTVSASATSVTLSGGLAYAGQTILAESEHIYITASTGGTALTIVRGVNGTTAAVHAAGLAVSVYRYPREVVTATLQVAQRRHRSAQAGLTGDFGGGNLPATGNRDSEWAILKANLSHLRRYAAA